MSYVKSIMTLLVIAVAAAAALTFTYGSTKPVIERIQKERQDAALKRILPDADSFEEKKIDGKTYFIAKKDDIFIGRIFREAQKGYDATPVTMLVGIGDENVVAVEILEQRETPGLGDKIKDDWFREQFKDKTKEDKLVVKEDIDSITGATISSKAVANGVKAALETNSKLEEN